MSFQLIDKMNESIKNNTIDAIMKNYIHGSFYCDIMDYETIGITEFELTTDDDDTITYDMDSDDMRLNEWIIPNKDCNPLFGYLLEYMEHIVQSEISTDTVDTFGMFFINLDKF